MITVLVALALLAARASTGDPPLLVVGKTLEGRITDADAVVHTPTLDRAYTTAPTVGVRYRVMLEAPGPFTIELRSWLFDAYLVLRDESGSVLAEDDDGLLLGTHARLERELAAGEPFFLEACALHGARGPFELRLSSGKNPVLSPAERVAAEEENQQHRIRVVEQEAGPESQAMGSALNDIGLAELRRGEFERARAHLERALSIRERAFGLEHPETAVSLNNLATSLRYLGRSEEARPLFERALVIMEKTSGPEHPQTALSLANLSGVLLDLGDHAHARPLLERALRIHEESLGPEHPDLAAALSNLGLISRTQGDLAGARLLYARALDILEKGLGPECPETAVTMNNLAQVLRALGDRAGARRLHERALGIWESIGPEHPYAIVNLIGLAALLKEQGDHAGARPLYERVLAIREKTLGHEDRETATSLNDLAVLLVEQGDYAAARRLHERALEIREKVLGPEHLDTAMSLNNLATLLQIQGDYEAARPLQERGLALDEKLLGPEHPDTARSLTHMAELLQRLGEFAEARPLYERALATRRKVLGAGHPGAVQSLLGLADLLQAQGDYGAALRLVEEGVEISERSLGPEHYTTGACLQMLGILLESRGDRAAARAPMERALAIMEKVRGPDHPDTAASLCNLANLLYSQKDYLAARPLYERALRNKERALGARHPDAVVLLGNLANLHGALGDCEAARRLHERALAIVEEVLGPGHPSTARARHDLALCLVEGGNRSEASSQALAALRSSLEHARRTLWSMSERERLSFLQGGESKARLVLSASTWPGLESLEPQAYELALAWKGLVSRSLLAGREQLQGLASEGAAVTLAQMQQVQSDLSKRLHAEDEGDSGKQEAIRSLRERRNALEVELQRLAGPGTERAVTLAELRGSLESGAAFLDLVVHSLCVPPELDEGRVVRKGGWTKDHLTAWILRPDRELVRIDLGLAAPIESEVKRWLGEIVSSRGVAAGERGEVGKKLRELLWEPLVSSLDGVERVFVRPDSFLGTLPFEVIPLEGGRYLIEEKGFVYVHTPLDLVERKQRASEGSMSLLTVGGVDFKRRAELEESSWGAAPSVSSAARGDELRGSLNQFWSRLPHTENEAQTVSDLFEAAFEGGERLMLTAEAPTEERLKRELPHHTIAHLATHGFFHPEDTVSMWDSAREQLEGDRLHGLDDEARVLVGQLPGLLTGLVCAGANEPAPAGRDDGLLTAEEVLWLDLSKVELVVLSACETALGERRSGEGMIGLRRAFGLAGAKTVVSSLWSVKDRSTSELMQRFYENLWLEKQGRAEALRNAQLEMLARNRATEGDALPSTWGAFVLSGEWR